MHPVVVDIARRASARGTPDALRDAICDIEDPYGALGEIEQEAATRLIDELDRRLAAATRQA